MVAQKKSQIARERDEEARGLWRWLASRFDASAVLKTTDPPLWRLSNVWDSGARKDAEAVLSFERSVHLHIAVGPLLPLEALD
jgi:hypothetical protein